MPARTPKAPPARLKIEVRSVAALLRDPANARMHPRANIEAIQASIRRFDLQKPIVVDRKDIVIAGNGTLEAAEAEGWEWIEVIVSQLDGPEARAYAITDNRTAELAEWDIGVLAATLSGFPADLLDTTGFTADDLLHIINDIDRQQRDLDGPDPDAVPAIKATAVSRLGDLWELGEHRLVVGDCTEAETVAVLMGEDKAVCMWTDPPYGVEYNDFATPEAAKAARRRTDGKRVQNDGSAGLPALLAGAFANAAVVLSPGSPVYVAHPSGLLSKVFQDAVLTAGWRWAETLIWVKNAMVLGRSDYHYRHEPILYGFTPALAGTGRRGRGGKHWWGDHSQTTVLEHAKPSRSDEHPTMKPVGLVMDCLRNSTPPDGIVYDPFAGSGSTLIAAELLGRRARLVELDPVYADVICRRFHEQTGTKPTRNGKPMPGLT